MAFKKVFCISFVALIAFTCATEVQKCSEDSKQVESSEVSVAKCDTPPCILRRKTTAQIELKVKPEKDIKDLITRVSAKILDVPLPFVGVDGISACENMYSEDGKTQVGCPLKGGETYLYKNSFKVHPFYPTVPLVVHWALQTPDEKDVVCFEVPARIR